MTRLFGSALGTLLPFLAVNCAHAQWLGDVGVGMRGVQHREVDAAGNRLVRETGWLPGVALNASYTAGRLTWFGALDGYRRAIRYQGRTQAGAAAESTTATTLAALRLGARYALGRDLHLAAALETDRWRRTIRASAGAAGLQERYRSERLVLGGGTRWQLAPGSVEADAAAVWSTPERMRVGFSGLLDPATLDTRSALGARIGLQFQPLATPVLALRSSLDWMRVARSGEVAVTRNGQFMGTIAQPEHTRVGLTLTLAALF